MNEPITPNLIDAWKEFERNLVPADFGKSQRRTVMFAFYAAASTVADRLMAAKPVNGHITDSIVQVKVECQHLANAIARTFPPA
jgi:hypothetical protein